ncbi:MAG: PmeII family type II restriction endonuclease, partial [Candidatus Thermoplasmatota archaeon]
MNNDELEKLIAKSLKDFYDRRINCLEELQLERFLKRKNPYLLRAIGMERASEIVESILNAHLSASDETIFGDAFFEPIATIVSGGKVSDAEGVDFT